MFKLLFYIFISVSVVFASELNLTNEEQEYLKNKKVLKVSSDTSYAPYDFVQNGVSTGYSTEYVRLVGRKLGIKLEFIVDSDFKVLFDKFCNKEIDIIHAADGYEKTRKCGNLSQPQIRDNRQIITRKNGFKKVNSLDDLVGFTMVTPSGWGNAKEIKEKYGDKIKHIESKNIQEALEFIRQGKADFTTGSSNVLKYFILKNGYKNLTFQGSYMKQDGSDNLYIASRKDEPLLQSVINKAMDSITIFEKNELRKKWFGDISNELTKAEKEYLANNEIRYCFDPTWKPMDFLNSKGEHDGIGALFIKDIEKQLDKKFIFTNATSWAQSLNQVKNKECDVISLVNDIEDRATYMNFTTPYLVKGSVIATKKDIPYVEDLDALGNVKIGVIGEYLFGKVLKGRYPSIEIVGFDSTEDGLTAVEKGEIFGFVNLTPMIALAISEKGFDVKISGEVDIANLEMSLGIRKDDPILLSIMQKSLDNISEAVKLEYGSLYTNIVKDKKVVDYTLVWQIIIVSILLLAVVGYWSRKLYIIKKELEKKNEQLDKLVLIQSRQATFGTMIDTISHQWKQPLNELGLQMMHLDTQLRFEGKVPTKESLELTIQKSNNILEFMSKTIDIFRNFFKTSSDVSDINISEVVNNTILFLDSTFEVENIKINKDIQKHIIIEAMEEEFAHSILNILVNAKDIFKQRDIENPIIDVMMKRKDNGEVIITIEDNAGGIKIEPIEYIFKSETSTKENGGIGLFITKKIIEEKLNGTVEVKNTNNGAKFTIKL